MNPYILRRCLMGPPAGHLVCPNPATHWKVVQGREIPGWGMPAPMRLDMCADHAAHERSDVVREGTY